MLDAGTSGLLRALLDDVCGEFHQDNATRNRVALKIMQAVSRGQQTIDGLKETGRAALNSTGRAE